MKAVFGEIEAEQRVESAKKLLKKSPTLQIREHLVNVWFCSCNVRDPRGRGLHMLASSLHAPARRSPAVRTNKMKQLHYTLAHVQYIGHDDDKLHPHGLSNEERPRPTIVV